MWTLHGIEPEVLDYHTMHIVHGAYPLRPEIVESAYTFFGTRRIRGTSRWGGRSSKTS